ncbi:hypothetical protein EYF88_06855 [Paracoccus sediminis]|uniref:Uncharacterized protein n=1 Tax=Paracoccus sediminis TaxID=1214787 RepID=A0A238W307_9RHOB|nr:hypothetical protein [Paracoccus sediminis]TBN51502.1 hypothetical protein EYF88_06855 [Paracoccus sediminis]SNR40533.1 hypothetical protein SAMN06265378_103283 [Paracoccus sediminis]
MPEFLEISEKELLERIVTLENFISHQETKKTNRLTAFASALALAISIMSGGLGLYNAFFIAPEIKIQADAISLSSKIDQHREDLAKLNSLPMDATPAQRSVAEEEVTFGQAAIMGSVKISSSEVLSALAGTDLVMLAWIAMMTEEEDISQSLANLAINRAATYGDRMTAKATLAQSILFFDPPRGEETFYNLFREITESESRLRGRAFLGAANQMIQVISGKRDCTGLSRNWKIMEENYIPLLPESAMLADYIEKNVNETLGNLNC